MLKDHGLRFHKKSTDGSGKCDIIEIRGETVHGVLFEMAVLRFHLFFQAEEIAGQIIWVSLDYGDGGYFKRVSRMQRQSKLGKLLLTP